MRRLTVALLGVGVLVVPSAAVAGSLQQDVSSIEQGMKVYAREGCRTCHTVDEQGPAEPPAREELEVLGYRVVRYPLASVGSRLTREQIRTWIVAPQEMYPEAALDPGWRGVRKAPYKLSSADLDALVAYLHTLRRKGQ